MRWLQLLLVTAVVAQQTPKTKEQRRRERFLRNQNLKKNGIDPKTFNRPKMPDQAFNEPLSSLKKSGSDSSEGFTMSTLLANKRPMRPNRLKKPEPTEDEGKLINPDVFNKVANTRQLKEAGLALNNLKLNSMQDPKTKNNGIFNTLSSMGQTMADVISGAFTARRGGKINLPQMNKLQDSVEASATNQSYYEQLLQSATCPDLYGSMNFEANKYPDQKPWTLRIPVYKVALLILKFRFDISEQSPLSYSADTQLKCDGTEGRHGDVCELYCPNLEENPNLPPIPVGQQHASNNGKLTFQCQCSVNPEVPSESVCYWMPTEKRWRMDFTCNQNKESFVKKKSPNEGLKLADWWQQSPHSQKRWDNSVSMLQQYIVQPPTEAPVTSEPVAGIRSIEADEEPEIDLTFTSFQPRSHLFNSQYQEDNQEDTFDNVLGLWPDQDELNTALENDSQYQILQSRLDQLDTIENKSELQRFEHQKLKKMTHLGKLISNYQLDGGKAFENFVKYGCYCMSSEKELHKGIGQPADPIDQACREHDLCVKCAGLDSFDKCHPYRGYQFSLSRDENNQLRFGF